MTKKKSHGSVRMKNGKPQCPKCGGYNTSWYTLGTIVCRDCSGILADVRYQGKGYGTFGYESSVSRVTGPTCPSCGSLRLTRTNPGAQGDYLNYYCRSCGHRSSRRR